MNTSTYRDRIGLRPPAPLRPPEGGGVPGVGDCAPGLRANGPGGPQNAAAAALEGGGGDVAEGGGGLDPIDGAESAGDGILHCAAAGLALGGGGRGGGAG